MNMCKKTGGDCMDKGNYREHYQEVISMEEYLQKRRKIRECEEEQMALKSSKKSPAWLMAELYI